MPNSIVKFENANLNCEINTITVDGVIYFRGKDVADALGYSIARKAIIDHVDTDYKDTIENIMVKSKRSVLERLERNEKQGVVPKRCYPPSRRRVWKTGALKRRYPPSI